MQGKSEEITSNSNQQSIQSNPYTQTNNNQQSVQSNPYAQSNNNQQYETVPEKSDEAPPPYNACVQPLGYCKAQDENSAQDPTFNNGIMMTPMYRWGRHSIQVVCPYCRRTVQTRVKSTSTILTILIAILLAFVCLCFALIPFFCRRCKKTSHYCPECHQILSEISEFQ